MKNNVNKTGKYKNLLAIQSSYNNHIHYIEVDENGEGKWRGHASCTVPLTVEELNEDAERFYKLINTPIEELYRKDLN